MVVLNQATTRQGFFAPTRFEADIHDCEVKGGKFPRSSTAPSSGSAGTGSIRRCIPMTAASTATATCRMFRFAQRQRRLPRPLREDGALARGPPRAPPALRRTIATHSSTIRACARPRPHGREHRAVRPRRQAVRAEGGRAALGDGSRTRWRRSRPLGLRRQIQVEDLHRPSQVGSRHRRHDHLRLRSHGPAHQRRLSSASSARMAR